MTGGIQSKVNASVLKISVSVCALAYSKSREAVETVSYAAIADDQIR